MCNEIKMWRKKTRIYVHTHASNSPYLSVTWLKCVQSAKYASSHVRTYTQKTRFRSSIVGTQRYVQTCFRCHFMTCIVNNFHSRFCSLSFPSPLHHFPFTIHRLFIYVYIEILLMIKF